MKPPGINTKPTPQNNPPVNANRSFWNSVGAFGRWLGQKGSQALSFIPGIGPVLSSLATSIVDNGLAKQAQKDAEKRSNAEYDRRIADERAYNSPSAVAQRLREAGINPQGAVSQVAGATGGNNMSAPSLSSMTGAPSIASGLANTLSSFTNFGKAPSEIQANTSKSELDASLSLSEHFKRTLYESEANLNVSKDLLAKLDITYQSAVMTPSIENAYLAVESAKSVIANTQIDTVKQLYEIGRIAAETGLTIQMAKHEGVKIEETKSKISLNTANVDKIKAEINRIDVLNFVDTFNAYSNDAQWRATLAQNKELEQGWMELEERLQEDQQAHALEMQDTKFSQEKILQRREFWFDLINQSIFTLNSNWQNKLDRKYSRDKADADRKSSEKQANRRAMTTEMATAVSILAHLATLGKFAL